MFLIAAHYSYLCSFNGFVIFLGDGGYPYAAQHLGLGTEGAKTTNKYGENDSFKVCDGKSVVGVG